jgi:CBS domain-containing protein
MLAIDVMTREVATVRPETPVAEAIAKMVAGRISGLPVVDEAGKLVGVVTEGDLLRRVELGTEAHRPGWLSFLRGRELAAAEYVRSHTLYVRDIMTSAPVSIDPAAPLDEVVKVMEDKQIRRVMVVHEGALVGIVSRADLVRALAKLMNVAVAMPSDDAAVREAILAELRAQDWFSMCDISVAVEGGKVTLEGVAQSEAARAALRVAAERVPGVVSVESHVVLLDPMAAAVGV